MRRRATGWLLAATVAGGLLTAGPAGAAIFDVTTTDDGTGACTASACTLRAALQAARANGNAEADTINVPAGDYLLTEGALQTGTTTRLVTIAGDGADRTTIRGDGQDRLLSIGGESLLFVQDVTFSGGTSASGEGGGNILSNAAILALNRVRITGGSAERGGGIVANGGALAITHSLIDGNHLTTTGSGDGGGILTLNGAGLQVTDSTITGNTAREGGGIASNGNTDNPTTLTRVTIAGNTATNSTGGGFSSFNGSRPADISGTIIANNLGQRTRSGALVDANCAGDAPVDGGGNLENIADCAFVRGDSRQDVADPGLATALISDGGPTPVLPITATSPARELAGACTGTDQRGVTRPNGALCDAGAYEFVPPPPQPQTTPTPTPAPTATPSPRPTPVPGKSVVAEPGGTILVRIPPSKTFVRISSARTIPLGSTVDARKGSVVITAGPKDVARFSDGIFKITQRGGVTTLTLTEKLAPCAKQHARAAARKPKTRKLWGDGKGRFRTKGSYSAATVRGTKWLVQDSCAGTLTRVTRGTVAVRDEVKKKTIILRKNQRYTARPKR